MEGRSVHTFRKRSNFFKHGLILLCTCAIIRLHLSHMMRKYPLHFVMTWIPVVECFFVLFFVFVSPASEWRLVLMNQQSMFWEPKNISKVRCYNPEFAWGNWVLLQWWCILGAGSVWVWMKSNLFLEIQWGTNSIISTSWQAKMSLTLFELI